MISPEPSVLECFAKQQELIRELSDVVREFNKITDRLTREQSAHLYDLNPQGYELLCNLEKDLKYLTIPISDELN